MALSGLAIQKLLPKTNCKECGCNTCLAFAMKLAGKKAELAECPYVSEEAKEILAAAAEPPIRTVTLGQSNHQFKAGGETVVYRHEKTFVNQTGLGITLNDDLDDAVLERRLCTLGEYELERVGEILTPDLVSVVYKSGSPERFLAVLDKVAALWQRPIVVKTLDADAMVAAAQQLRGRHPLLASATAETLGQLGEAARETGASLAVTADSFDELVAMVERLVQSGFRDIFLDLGSGSLCEHYQNNTVIRRAALRGGVKALGYPILRFIDTGDSLDDAVEAGIELTKYGGVAVLPGFDPAEFAPLLTLRQNIFTDPQKPIQVEPMIYPVGDPDENSPFFVTTNFSLTYFIVSGEIENSGTSAWLVVPECEGMSVLTAWAAGKFGGDMIGAFVKESRVEERMKERRIVIPGYVPQILGELEEALPGWEVLVGPQEAGDIELFVKKVLQDKSNGPGG